MTDNEIIKALKCFAIDKDFDVSQCVGCAFESKSICCENASEGIAKASLDLINRQQAEIKEWKRVIETWVMQHEKDKAEIERLKEVKEQLESDVINANMNLEHMTAEAERWRYQLELVLKERADHSEAIKQFAERLCEGRVLNDPVVIAVKAELKEMVGDTE